MTTKIITGTQWHEHLLTLPRIGTSNVTAFYEHRINAICTDARYLLVPLDDHLVHRGDGIFESLTILQGKIVELDAHLTRLKHSAQTLKIELPLTWDEIRSIIIDVAKAGKSEHNTHGSIKILAGRGEGGMGISPKECPVASFYCIASKAEPLPESFWKKGLTACKSKIPAKQEYMAQIKSTNYLPNVFMAQEAQERGFNVSLSFDEKGNLAEAAIANVGLIDKEGHFALPQFRNTLKGTTALLAMELAKKHLIKSCDIKSVMTRDIKEEEIYNARELFILGTGPECVGITHFEGKPICDGSVGEISKKLKELIHKSLLETGTPF